jgi:hypothetical protein
MTLDEYCRLAAIHFEPQHRAAMTAFWKKYGDRNFIDRSLDQAEKQLNFESTIYFNNNLASWCQQLCTTTKTTSATESTRPREPSTTIGRPRTSIFDGLN